MTQRIQKIKKELPKTSDIFLNFLDVYIFSNCSLSLKIKRREKHKLKKVMERLSVNSLGIEIHKARMTR